MDLVEVSPVSNPPVCKIIDYGKFLYQKDKSDRKNKAKAKRTEIKGIRLTLKMSEHDQDVRRNQAQKFLNNGDKVKIEMNLRGREQAYAQNARERIEGFIHSLEGNISKEQGISRQGGRLSIIVFKK